MSLEKKKYEANIPEKNCAISSFEQPNGSPRSLTQPSSIAFSKFKPLRFTTHSISDRLALNTETREPITYGSWLHYDSPTKCACESKKLSSLTRLNPTHSLDFTTSNKGQLLSSERNSLTFLDPEGSLHVHNSHNWMPSEHRTWSTPKVNSCLQAKFKLSMVNMVTSLPLSIWILWRVNFQHNSNSTLIIIYKLKILFIHIH